MEELAKKRKIRGGHRGYLTKVLAQAKQLVDNFNEENRYDAVQLRESIMETVTTVKKLDDDIIGLIADDKDSTAEVVGNEIEDTAKTRGDATKMVKRLDDVLKVSSSGAAAASVVQETNEGSELPSVNGAKIRAKLPKLEVKRFGGNVCKWQEFWDSFESSIHKNECLSDVDKFNYLRGLIDEPAKSCIAGFSLTSANYNSAVDILKDRYGKKSAIQRAHMQKLMKIDRVRDERDVVSLRHLCDSVETHYRGLEALGVDKDTYSSIVVPVILDRLPEAVRLIVTRGKDFHEWTLEDLLLPLKKEVDLREEHREPERRGGRENTEKQSWKRGPSSTHAFFTKSGTEACAFCLGEHRHEDCKRVNSAEKRKELLKKYSRCFNCLKKGHLARNCTVKVKCNACSRDHHTALCDRSKLHEDKPKEPEVDGEVGKVGNCTLVVSPKNSIVKSGCRVALQTAQAMLVGRKSGRVRVLFDSGSQRTFVTVKTARELGCTVLRKEALSVGTFGQRALKAEMREVVRLNLKPLRGNSVVSVEAYVVPEISFIRNQHLEVVKESYAHLKGLWLSDVCMSNEELEVDVLVGADYLWMFQKDRMLRGDPGEPVAVDTVLGWVISGPVGLENLEEKDHVRVNFVTGEVNQDNLNRFWDLESIGIKPDTDVHESVINDLSFNGQRYSVGLPWRENHDPLHTNYELSLKRMKGQIRRLSKDPRLLGEYDSIIKAQEEAGIIERVSSSQGSNPDSKVHYIPHQAVVRENAETTKVRIVYDASAKAQKGSVSLNDCLHAGPSLNPLLFDILLRFREQRVALVADIEKAFLNIEVHEKDRDSLRFVWVKDVLRSNMNLAVYRFCRVVFGVNSSPFLLNATLRHHIGKYAAQDAQFSEKLLRSFYVDDLATGEKTTESAYSLYDKANKRMAEGGFRLRKWRTNDQALRSRIEAQNAEFTQDREEHETYAKTTLACPAGSQVGKVLGLEWDCMRDLIKFDFAHLVERAQNTEPSKRNVLSLLACIFDPLGLLSPTVVKAKILFQDICISGLDWDDTLSRNLRDSWERWLRDFSEAKEVTIQRYAREDSVAQTRSAKYWLHGFGDASKRAYCAVIYFVTIAEDKTYVKLIASKTRVAPIKELSIPRLELMAARILAQLMHGVKNALGSEYNFEGTRYWTDSKTTLCWIRNTAEWKQFVQHRVNEILKLCDKRDWGHCAGIENPADLGSRGVLISELKNSNIWWSGPEWLKGRPADWPCSESILPTRESKIEEKGSFAVNLLINVNSLFGISNLMNLSKFSSLTKLVRVTAWVKRFVSNLKGKKIGDVLVVDRTLKVSELEEAELEWVKVAQLTLKDQGSYSQIERQYGLVEKEGVLHCTGRLSESELDREAREPIVLPKGHKFTELIIEQCHDRVMHSGVRSTLAQVRSKYWIPKGRQEVKRVTGACVVCKRWNSNACTKPQPAALPEFRVTRAAPFENSGVDFAGPLFAKAQNGTDKVYIALFTCCVTRAVHLELVQDLSAATFLRCLRWFTSRRGTPRIIVSDNAKTFKAAKGILRELFGSEEVKNCLTSKGIDWRFNLERAPWWGGFFERLIGLAKACLRKVLGRARLTFDELRTVLVEVEANLNTRPLTYQYDEVSAEVLTPSHLMHGRRITSLPDGHGDKGESSNRSNSIARFKYLSTILEHFWNRWKKEYLTNLREFHKVGVSEKGSALVKPGDVVIVFEQGKKRGEWKTGVVQELIKGKDEVARGARVCVMTNGRRQVLSRSVQHLYPVEIREGEEMDDELQWTFPPLDKILKKIGIGKNFTTA